jgi:hypothetical protein
MVKVNVPAVALATLKVNGAPDAVGVNDAGVGVQVPGFPAVQERVTLLLYPLIAVRVPLQVTLWLATVELGVAVTAIEKSGTGAVTCSENVCVLAAGAPEVVAESVTVELPTGVLTAAVTVNVTVTGVLEVGFTVAEGEKAHAAPVGRPLGQLSVTEPEKEPDADTTNVLWFEVPPCTTFNVFGFGAVSAKSTTCSVAAASWVVVPASVPTPWALKL